MIEHARHPLRGKLRTPGFTFLLAVVAAGILITVYRLFHGLGAVTAMNDGFPWGIWKPFNILTLTGMASGSLVVGVLTYVFNRGEYHSLLRSAVIAGALGYTLAGLSVLADLGRYWNLWIIFAPSLYNLNSVLLEVAVCIVAYTIVLWIEVAPIVLEQWSRRGAGRFKTLGVKLLPFFKKALPWVIGLAVVLPLMHQSSLGGLYMIAVTKLHALWHTSWLPGLFLLTCLTMGFGSVFVVENLTAMYLHRKIDQKLVARIARVAAVFTAAFILIRFGDLLYGGRLNLAFALDFYSYVFLAEMTLFIIPTVMLLFAKVRQNRGWVFLMGMILLAGGIMYRFDVYLTAYTPASGWTYFPSVSEIVFSAALLAGGVAIYLLMCNAFPILSGVLKKSVEKERTFA